jgi:hypothetical protein
MSEVSNAATCVVVSAASCVVLMFLEGVVPADAAATDVGTLGGDDATSMEASAVPSK